MLLWPNISCTFFEQREKGHYDNVSLNNYPRDI